VLRCNVFHVSLALVVDGNPGGEHGREGQLTDRIGLGVLTRLVHRDLVDEVLAGTGRTERRRRKDTAPDPLRALCPRRRVSGARD